MFSMPAATTRSRCPAWIADAPFIAACIDEPHWRSTVVAQTVSGKPAISEATRPTFRACSPTCETQPIWMSSTAPGVDVVARDERAQHLRGELVGTHRGEGAVPLPDRAADRVDDQGITH